MRISFVGAGNVAWHLAQVLEKSGKHSIEEVCSRTKSSSKKLADKLYNAEATTSLDFSESKADLIIISVPDDAIFSVASQINVNSKCTIVHTSGTMGIDELKPIKNANKGVFYPLQTFSKSKNVNFKNVPLCLEATNTLTEDFLEKLAFDICENVAFVNSADRKILHLGAVFACNFTNHLMGIAKQILEKEGLNFAILKPLIQETVEKALTMGPEKSQTGPAARNDTKTIESQTKLLAQNSSWQNIYKIVTDSIRSAKYVQ